MKDRSVIQWDKDDLEDMGLMKVDVLALGMLTAIPKTPLYARLAGEGRLDLDDNTEFGTNVIPLRMSREALRDGYVRVLKDLYEPEAFFGRVDDLYLTHRTPCFAALRDFHRRNPWRQAGDLIKDMSKAVGLFARLMSQVPEVTLRREYRRRLAELDDEAAEADSSGDVERSARIAAERDALVDQLSAAFGLGGRPRRAGSPVERARTTVTARIRDAVRRVVRCDRAHTA